MEAEGRRAERQGNELGLILKCRAMREKIKHCEMGCEYTMKKRFSLELS